MRRRGKALRVADSARKTAPITKVAAASDLMQSLHRNLALAPPIPTPPNRRLRIFAYDPSLQTDPDMFGVNEAIVVLRWEKDLGPGPVGEYLEVVDVDPASRCCYAPVDLDNPNILVRRGLTPSEADPQFHQQMV